VASPPAGAARISQINARTLAGVWLQFGNTSQAVAGKSVVCATAFLWVDIHCPANPSTM
jgi:hypothetical protein